MDKAFDQDRYKRCLLTLSAFFYFSKYTAS